MNYSEKTKRKTWARNFSPIVETINNNKNVKVPYVRLKPLFMFTLMNIAICLSALIVLRHAGYALLAITLGILGPLIALMLSKTLAKSAFNLKVIDPENFLNNNEQQLYNVVEVLSNKAGLKTVPEVAIYQSPDINAFATGPSRNNSIVAFSSTLLDKMDEKAFAAVAAHEIAHVANGDMLTMTLLQSAINTVVIIIDMALASFMYNKKDGLLAVIIKAVFRWIVVYICFFIGNLFAMWYSRHREFKADALASKLVNADSMIQALNLLKEDQDIEIPEHIAHAQEAYASFKISSGTTFLEWFSTHPSLDKRIVKLKTGNAIKTITKTPEISSKDSKDKRKAWLWTIIGIAVGAWLGMIASGMIGVTGYIGGIVGAIITGVSVYRSSMKNGGAPPAWLCSSPKKE